MQYRGYTYSKKIICLSAIQIQVSALYFYLLNLARYLCVGKKLLDGMDSVVWTFESHF